MKTLEDRLGAARQILLEMEARESNNFALARKVLGEMEEDVRALRMEVGRKQIEIFTEEEFAAKLKISVTTLRRIRREGRVQPLQLTEKTIRYSSLQLERVHEIFPRAARSGLRKVS